MFYVYTTRYFFTFIYLFFEWSHTSVNGWHFFLLSSRVCMTDKYSKMKTHYALEQNTKKYILNEDVENFSSKKLLLLNICSLLSWEFRSLLSKKCFSCQRIAFNIIFLHNSRLRLWKDDDDDDEGVWNESEWMEDDYSEKL